MNLRRVAQVLSVGAIVLGVLDLLALRWDSKHPQQATAVPFSPRVVP